MNHAAAAFFFDDGEVLYGVYNGTLNVMRPILSPDPDAPLIWADMTREHTVVRGTTAIYEELEDEIEACEHQAEHVVAACGQRRIAWHGVACRQCLLFLGPFYPHELEADELLEIKSTREGGELALKRAPSCLP